MGFFFNSHFLRLISFFSLDRTVRTYSFPDLEFQFVLGAHRAAVNAVSISESFIVSASGDRSVRLWDADTGKLLRTFENHHTRGYVSFCTPFIQISLAIFVLFYSIASIDFCPPVVLSGSSDKHIRLFDMTTMQGWSTSPEYDGVVPQNNALLSFPLLSGAGSSTNDATGLVCQSCGSSSIGSTTSASRAATAGVRCVHNDLVRTVALGEDFALSGSYDLSIKVHWHSEPFFFCYCATLLTWGFLKVWDRKTGALVADLTGGHTGRIFCIGFDSKKVRSNVHGSREIISSLFVFRLYHVAKIR